MAQAQQAQPTPVFYLPAGQKPQHFDLSWAMTSAGFIRASIIAISPRYDADTSVNLSATRRTELHRRRAACTGIDQGRPAWRRSSACSLRIRPSPNCSSRRLCQRAVRQEPSRRQGRIPADGPRLRRFFGNLYHLNAEEEPENPDYPKDPELPPRFGPRGVIRSSAPTAKSRTRPLTMKRMETVDDESCAALSTSSTASTGAGKPWFCYFNPTRMHV